MEYIHGVTMNDLTLKQRRVVETELERYLETLRGLRSDAWGGPSGIVGLLFLHQHSSISRASSRFV